MRFLFAMILISVSVLLLSCDNETIYPISDNPKVHSEKVDINALTHEGRVEYYKHILEKSRFVRSSGLADMGAYVEALKVESITLHNLSQELLNWKYENIEALQ